jgi:hypothetical protein
MSLPGSETPALSKSLTIDVGSRRSERRVGVLALSGVGCAIALLSLPPAYAVPLFVLAAVAVIGGLWSQGWLGGAHRVTAVSWLSDGQWLLSSATQKNIPATLSEDSRIGSRWLWLRWHIAGASRARHRSLLLLKGDVLPAELRRLCARLRLESLATAQPSGARR